MFNLLLPLGASNLLSHTCIPEGLLGSGKVCVSGFPLALKPTTEVNQRIFADELDLLIEDKEALIVLQD